MNDLLVAAALTFAASAHCFGMCGGLMISVAARGKHPGALRDFLLLQAGKASSYAFLGSLAGLAGASLLSSPLFVFATRGLAILAAIALGAAGLMLLGFGRGGARESASIVGLWSRVFGPLLTARPRGFPLVVGLAMGFFPCPLVYAGVAAAAATASPARGAVTLAGVALGTLPALALASLTTHAAGTVSSASVRWRGVLARAAGVLLLGAAALTAARAWPGAHEGHGAHPAPSTHESHDPGAPLCTPSADPRR